MSDRPSRGWLGFGALAALFATGWAPPKTSPGDAASAANIAAPDVPAVDLPPPTMDVRPDDLPSRGARDGRYVFDLLPTTGLTNAQFSRDADRPLDSRRWTPSS